MSQELLSAIEHLPGEALVPISWVRLMVGASTGQGFTPDMRLSEVATMYGRSAETVRRWCCTGVIPGAYKLGAEWRIPRSSLEKLGDVARDGKCENASIVSLHRVTPRVTEPMAAGGQ